MTKTFSLNILPKISFQVRLTMLFFLVSILVELGLIAVVRHQYQQANLAENYQYLEQENAVSARTIGEVIWSNLEILELLSHNSTIVDSLISSNQQYAQQGAQKKDKLSDLDKKWSANREGELVEKTLSNSASLELNQANKILDHFDQLYITNKYGALEGSVKYTNRFDFSQQKWWKLTFNQGRGSVYIGNMKFDDKNRENLVVPIAIPVYHPNKSDEIIGIIYGEHSFNYELESMFGKRDNQASESAENEGINHDYEHRIYFEDNKYFDYTTYQISINSELTLEELEQIKKEVQSGNYEIYQEDDNYIMAKKISTLEYDNKFTQAIDNLDWYLVTISPRKAQPLFSLSSRLLFLLIIGIVLLILSIFFTLYILNLITTPIQQMIKIARDIRINNFTRDSLNRLDKAVTLDNDIGELARVFKEMALIITNRTQSLKQQINELEMTTNIAMEHDYLTSEFNQKARLNLLQKSQALRNQLNAARSGSNSLKRPETNLNLTTQLEPEFIQSVQQELAKYIGPVSQHLIEDNLEKFTLLTPIQFIELLATEIPDPEHSEHFRQQLLSQLSLTPSLTPTNINLSQKVEPEFWQRAQDELSEYIGPIAEPIVQEILEQRSRLTPPQLVELLAAEIPDLNQAREFKQKLLTETRAIPALTTPSNLTLSSTVDPDFLQEAKQELAQYIGPMSESIINEIVEQRSRLTPRQLVELLAAEIPDAHQATEFKQILLAKTSTIPSLTPSSNLTLSKTVEPKFLQRAKQELKQYIGPMAEPIINEIVEQRSRLTEKQLVELLMAEIPNGDQAKEFEQKLLSVSQEVSGSENSDGI